MAKMSLSKKAQRLLRAGTCSAAAMAMAVVAMPGAAWSQQHGSGNWNAERGRAQASGNGDARNTANAGPGNDASRRGPPDRASEERRPQEQTGVMRWRDRANAPQEAPQRNASAQPRYEPQPRNEPQRGNEPQQANEPQRESRTRTQQELIIRNDGRDDRDHRRGDRDTWRDGQRDRDGASRHDRSGWRDGERRDWRNDRPGYRDTQRRDWGNRKWNKDWRQERRYDWDRYRSAHRHIYRPGRYYAPYDRYYYRPLSAGFFLDSMFFSSRYWIADPWYYRLPPAYGPYRWVRYYDDVLLVDTYTGEVVDVIRNFFW